MTKTTVLYLCPGNALRLELDLLDTNMATLREFPTATGTITAIITNDPTSDTPADTTLRGSVVCVRPGAWGVEIAGTILTAALLKQLFGTAIPGGGTKVPYLVLSNADGSFRRVLQLTYVTTLPPDEICAA